MGKTVRGVIVRISGPVLDMRFAAGEEPPINALVQTADGTHHMEVAMQVQAGIVRCVALEATEGLRCGKEVFSDGEGIKVPVGDAVIGRVVDVIGRPIDGKGEIRTEAVSYTHLEIYT